MTARQQSGIGIRLLGAVLVLVSCLALFEVVCQAYARLVLFPRFDDVLARPEHYYHASPSPILAYELRPGVEVQKEDGRRLRIGRHGIRALDDDLARDQWRIAVLGDSVVFGVGHDETKTLSGRLQHEMDPAGRAIRVFNFGLGGLNLPEIVEFLRLKDAAYDVDEVLYLLNPNDFARRESIYEGADNGLYRMYERPQWMTLWFVRKAIYRFHKSPLTHWYQWMFSGNEEYGYRALREMSDYAREHGIEFSVVLLPSGVSYADGAHAMDEIYAKIGAFLSNAGIRYLDPTADFRDEPMRYYDETDHFQDEGNVKMAAIMARFLRGNDSVVRTRSSGR